MNPHNLPLNFVPSFSSLQGETFQRKVLHSLQLTVRNCHEATPKGNSSSNHPFSGVFAASFFRECALPPIIMEVENGCISNMSFLSINGRKGSSAFLGLPDQTKVHREGRAGTVGHWQKPRPFAFSQPGKGQFSPKIFPFLTLPNKYVFISELT